MPVNSANSKPDGRLAPGTARLVLARAGLLREEAPFRLPSDGALGSIHVDSRKIGPGDLFIAFPGTKADAHTHVPTAAAAGAGLLVVERREAIPSGTSVPWVEVTNGRAAWATLAAAGWGDPQDRMRCLAVTGTNGKTSTVWMARALLAAAGTSILAIGTIGAFLGDTFVPTTHTTPDPDVLYKLMAQALDQSIQIVAMEASSHAIVQEKMRPMRFAGAAFTSFSRDHLDFHPTMAEYLEAKLRLFTERSTVGARFAFCSDLPLAALPGGIANIRFIYGKLASRPAAKLGAESFLELKAHGSSFAGTDLEVELPGKTLRGHVPYFAQHAVENFAAALLLAASVEPSVMDPAKWAALTPVPGRLEQVTGKSPVRVVVDYAHTPDALEKTLEVLRPLCAGMLRVVFGCGGDRDKGKRPQMGAIAERLADRVYLTSDNPRSEAPEAILADIRAGLGRPDLAVSDPDRARAIGRAIADAAPDDLVLIAGKGHEAYQILASQTVPFDDRLVSRQYLDG